MNYIETLNRLPNIKPFLHICLCSPAKPIHHHGQDCLRLRVDVAGRKSPSRNHHEKSKEEHSGKSVDGGKSMPPGSGGVHNPSNRLPAGERCFFFSSPFQVERVMKSNPDSSLICLPSDDPAVMEPNVQRSIGNSAARLLSSSLFFCLIPILLTLMLRSG